MPASAPGAAPGRPGLNVPQRSPPQQRHLLGLGAAAVPQHHDRYGTAGIGVDGEGAVAERLAS